MHMQTLKVKTVCSFMSYIGIAG